VLVISVRGELDLATAPELSKVLKQDLPGEAPILINLTDCEFIDSTGIAVIVRAWQQRQARDGEGPGASGQIGLCGPDKQVSRLLEVTGVGTAISVFGDCNEALEKLRNLTP
jgi:anti-anti-sigma factor